MERKNYNVPEIDVLCVDTDVITSDSYEVEVVNDNTPEVPWKFGRT